MQKEEFIRNIILLEIHTIYLFCTWYCLCSETYRVHCSVILSWDIFYVMFFHVGLFFVQTFYIQSNSTFSHSTFSHFQYSVVLHPVILRSVILRSVILRSVILYLVFLRSVRGSVESVASLIEYKNDSNKFSF
jgi:hypothetical protein